MSKSWLTDAKPVMTGIFYLGSAVGILEGAFRLTTHVTAYRAEWMHMTALPMVVVLTRCLHPQAVTWSQHDAHWLLIGGTLGTTLYSSWLATVAAQNWVENTRWKVHLAPDTRLKSLLVTTFGHAAVAFNEEHVFRGAGLTMWAEAIGYHKAVFGLSTLFALSHRPKTMAGFSGYFTLGLLLTVLRTTANSLWLPIGYHWGWNVSQLVTLVPVERSSPTLTQRDSGSPTGGSITPETSWRMTVLQSMLSLAIWMWRNIQHQPRKDV